MDYKLLRVKMLMLGVDVKALCDAIGISTSAFYKKTRGKTEFTRAEMQGISDYLHLTWDETRDIFFPALVS